jgi:hypothetical protein
MGPLGLAAIMAAAGLAKSEFVDKPNEMRERKRQAEVMRYSPWTGMSPQAVQSADPFAAALQGGMAGGMMGQGMQSADAQNKLLEAQAKYYGGGASPYAGMTGGATGAYPGSMVG